MKSRNRDQGNIQYCFESKQTDQVHKTQPKKQQTTSFYTHLLLKKKVNKLQQALVVTTFPPQFLPLKTHASCDLENICGKLGLNNKNFEQQQHLTEGNPSFAFSQTLKSPVEEVLELMRLPINTTFRSRQDCSRNSTETEVILLGLVPVHPGFLPSIWESKTREKIWALHTSGKQAPLAMLY